MEYIVSACFVGVNCTYDGTHNFVPEIAELVASGNALPLCPEQLGGLSTPRTPAEIKGGDGDDVLRGKAFVLTEGGIDVTAAYLRGAREALRLARIVGAKRAITKDRSPSCGCEYVWRDHKLVNGKGVMAALFRREGIEVIAMRCPSSWDGHEFLP